MDVIYHILIIPMLTVLTTLQLNYKALSLQALSKLPQGR